MKQAANNPWTIRNKFRGELTNKSQAIVMDNSRDRDNPNKVVVNYFITENLSLLAGNNTVAVFRFKKTANIFNNDTSILSDLPLKSIFTSSEFGLKMVKSSVIKDEKIGAYNPFGDLIFFPADQIVIVLEKPEQEVAKEISLNSTSLFTNYLSALDKRDKKKSAATVNSDTQ